MDDLLRCLPLGNRTRRISITDHELFQGTSIYEWKERIRNLFIHAKIEWSTKYELLMNDIFELYHHHIPFHNHTHAYDVLQMGICLIVKCNALLKKISVVQRFTFCVALLCHDIDHRGHTNSDLDKNRSCNNSIHDCDIDDESLHSYCSSHSHNEKHHLSTACRLFRKHNIAYDKPVFATLVAHTDLLRHQSFVENVQNKGSGVFTIEDQLILLMKLADIGHILRPWKLHLHFVHTMNMERVNPLDIRDLPGDTINFNRTFVYPLLLLMKQMNLTFYTKLNANYEKNIQKWIEMKDFMSINQLPNRDSFPN